MPTVLPTILSMGREGQAWALAEVTYGVEIKPTTTSQFLLAGDSTVQQNRGFIPDPQRRNTYSARPQIAGRYEPGTISFPVLIKPRAAGVAPDAKALLKALIGRETIVASTSVTYNLLRIQDTRQSLTMWVRAGHFIYRALGVILTKGTFPIKADNSEEALGRCNFEGTFSEMKWTGTDEMAAVAAIAATSLTVKDDKKFTVGSYIKIADNDNAGLGYQVTAINYGTNILTITPGLTAAVALDALITPWAPTGSETGVIVHGRHGVVTRGAVSLPLMGGEITLEFPVKIANEEKNGLDFASRFINTGERTVMASMEALFDANGAKWFHDVTTSTAADLVCNWGNAVAARYSLTVKNQLIESPQVTGTEEQIVQINGKGASSVAFDDELTMVFN